MECGLATRAVFIEKRFGAVAGGKAMLGPFTTGDVDQKIER